MPALTRRRYPERPDCWHVYYGDVHVGTIAKRAGIPDSRSCVGLVLRLSIIGLQVIKLFWIKILISRGTQDVVTGA